MTEQVKLTPAQTRVQQALDKGKTPKQIAKSMRITRNGVYAHIRKLREKGVIPEKGANGDQPTNEVEEAPVEPATSSNGSPEDVGEVLGGVRSALRNQIEVVDERISEIDTRTDQIDQESEVLANEKVNLTGERTSLASTREKLYEASGESVPF